MAKPTTLRGLVTRRNLWALIIELVVLAAVVVVLAVYHRELYSRVFGPFKVTADEIGAIASLDSEFRRYFQLDEGRLVYMGSQEMVRRGRRGREYRSIVHYNAISAKQVVILRSAEKTPTLPVVGTLEPLPPDVADGIMRSNPQLKIGAGLSPLMLEVEDPMASWASFIVAAALSAPVLLLIFVVLTLGRLRSFQRSRSMAALARFQVPVDQIAAQIDDELAAESAKTAMRNVLLTRSWLLHLQPFKVEVFHLNELVWVHAAITRRYMYWFIPAGSTNYLRLGDRNGKLITIQGRKNAIPDVIVAIAERVPWVFAGHSDELEDAFKRNREAVIAAVDQRRQQLLSQAPAAG
jgi:hypothetical protein